MQKLTEIRVLTEGITRLLLTSIVSSPMTKPATTRKRSRHIYRKDGEGWTVESCIPFQITCCDCGVTHTLVLVSGRKGTPIGIAAKRDSQCTAQRRRFSHEGQQLNHA